MKSESATECLLPRSAEPENPRGNAQRSQAKLLVVNPLEYSGWEDLIATHPDTGFFHGSAWANVLHEAYGYTPLYLTIRENDRLLALWPFMEVSSWLTGKRGVSLPFTDECSPIFSDAAAAQQLIAEVTEFGRARHWDYWEARGTSPFSDNAPASITYYGHVLDMSAGEATIFQRFKGSVRTAIRKAEKSGIEIETGRSREMLKAFYELNCGTRQKHGLPPQPWSFFCRILENVLEKNLGTVIVGRHKGRPVSAAVFFHLGKKVIYKYGASDETVKELAATNLVLWEGIRQFIREGRQIFNFGRSSWTNEGLRKFKLAWATDEATIKYNKYDLKRGAYVSNEPESNGWHNRVFNLMPQFLSRKVGAMLYKHVA
jgi:hypothetical protein